MKKRKYSDNKMHRYRIYISLWASCCIESFATRIVIKDYSDLLIDAAASFADNDAISTFMLILCFSQRGTQFYWNFKGKI